MFPKIVSCSTLRIGPYLFHIEKFITQFKTTENNYRSPHSFSKKWWFTSIARSSRKEKAAIFQCMHANHMWNYAQWGCAAQCWRMPNDLKLIPENHSPIFPQNSIHFALCFNLVSSEQLDKQATATRALDFKQNGFIRPVLCLMIWTNKGLSILY